MKTKNLLTLLTSIIFISQFTSAQITFQKTIGGSGNDYGTISRQTADNGYIICGTTGSFGAGMEDIYLVKTNVNGDTLWTKTYGGTNNEYGSSVQQTNDRGYIITGSTKSFGTGDRDIYLLKTDSAGNVLWTKTFNATGEDIGSFAQQTSDGGYVIAGSSQSSSLTNYDVDLIKTDANGDTLWTRTFSGSGYEDGNFVQQTNDGGYIITGTTASFGAGGYDFYIIKTNASGNILWAKSYGGTGDDYAFSIKQNNDSGYVVTGATSSFGSGFFDAYLMRINSTGTVAWTKVFGGTDYDDGVSAQQTSDNGFIMLGQAFSFGVGSDVYIIKTNASGDTLWTRIFGGTGYEFGGSVQQTNDGGFFISAGEESFNSSREMYILKTDVNGNSGCNQGSTGTIVSSPVIQVATAAFMVSGGFTINSPAALVANGGTVNSLCTSVGIHDIEGSITTINVFPNPFSNELIISGTKQKGIVIVVDVTGKEIIQQKGLDGDTKINTQNLTSGFYFINYMEENNSAKFKLVKF